MKILHITNWYYSEKEPYKVPFIKEHIEALNLFADNTLVHVEVQDDNEFYWKRVEGTHSNWESFNLLKTRKIPWKIKEYLSSRLLLQILKEHKVNDKYDVLNIHTAYPLCTNINKLLQKVNIPIVFTEHWTAFSFNFNLPENAKSLDTIRNIYQKGIPIISVSEMLAKDIKRFSRCKSLNYNIVPNVVRSDVFSFEAKELERNPTFFMVNYWRDIKSPFVVFEAFEKILVDYPNAQLRVGGYGPLWDKMESFVKKQKLENNIKLLGRLEKNQIAKELQGITAFVHAAKFETFSVVTAEALMCGTPVIVSNLPCIAEYVDETNGILVNEDLNNWKDVLKQSIENQDVYDRRQISESIKAKFSQEAVGRKYFSVLKNV